MTPSDSDALKLIFARLTAIEASQARIEAALSQHQHKLAASDRSKIDRLLPLLPTDVFSARSLRRDCIAMENTALATILDSIGNQRRLGRLFARCADAGYGVRLVSSGPPSLWARS